MSWTYDPACSVDKDRVRLLVGDTITEDQQMADEEITFLLTTESNVYAAAAACARALAMKYARYVDKWVGDLKILASQRVKHYTDLFESLRVRGLSNATPSAGGVNVLENQAAAQDTSLIQPFIVRGRDDNTTGV